MMEAGQLRRPPTQKSGRAARLSYKFQRLRERIRQALISGELSGKLPGERELARRFGANPKTLSKALTDLAAEGLLCRCIGRGTYVTDRGRMPLARKHACLVICDPGQQDSALVRRVLALRQNAEVVEAGRRLRPSYLSRFGALIDLSSGTDESFLRDLLVRGIHVVLVGRDCSSARFCAVLQDRIYAATRLTQDLILAGHSRLLVIDRAHDDSLIQGAQMAARRYDPAMQIERVSYERMAAALSQTHDAVLCYDTEIAAGVRTVLGTGADELSLVATGVSDGPPVCTGIYVSPAELAREAVNLLEQTSKHRPVTLWLSGTPVDRGTIRGISPYAASQPGGTAAST